MLKGRTKDYFAIAEWSGGQVIVKEGSKISLEMQKEFKYTKNVLQYRSDTSVVDSNGKIKKDILFSSLTAAAQFVTGMSVNGRKVWKTKEEKRVCDI